MYWSEKGQVKYLKHHEDIMFLFVTNGKFALCLRIFPTELRQLLKMGVFWSYMKTKLCV